MIYIFTGCLSFVFFYIFDLNKIKFKKRSFNIFFAAGIALMAVSTVGVLFESNRFFEFSTALKLLFGTLSIVSLFMILYSLFFALPFHKTYIDTKKGEAVINTGMYTLCRHPGVIWFFFFYLFLLLASGRIMMIWAAIIWITMDIIYVYIQDRWLFPKTLNGYEEYKSEVPFLIPNLASIRRTKYHLKIGGSL